MKWLGRAKANLLPLSTDKNDIRSAFGEWEYHGEMNDAGEAVEVCRLCDHPNIRFQFEILNKNNQNTLPIGSECITKFGVQVFDENGNVLEGVHARKKVVKDRRRLIIDAKVKRMINSILNLCKIPGEKLNFENFITDYQKRGAFTPKQLDTLLWRMDVNKVGHTTSDFKVYIKKTEHKTQLMNMKDWQLKRLWPALSATQKNIMKIELHQIPIRKTQQAGFPPSPFAKATADKSRE